MATKANAPVRATPNRILKTRPGFRSGAIGVNGDGVGRGQVAEIQRARMLTSMVREISERGAASVSVAHIVSRSGVSRRTFYEIFEDREDCFRVAFEEGLKQIAGAVIPTLEQPGSWRARIQAALIAMLQAFDYDRATARLLIVESLAAGPNALQRRQEVLAKIVPIIREGSREGRAGYEPPLLTAEGVVGGVLAVLHGRLIEADGGELLDLAAPLMGMIVLPYLGASVARKESERPTPKAPVERAMSRSDPLQDLPMRLTYRTMRALTSVAASPGSSNRAISQSAGIGDQGQASKLLARLHKLGLIENEGGDPARGEANAWTLTATGKEVHDAIAGLEAQAS